ncbi:MAG: hypothetical protein EXR40_06005 [Nitrosomonadaceae bacterium]|nr:hypothetical protein [Nitrosomonadaceae bacterium]
MAVAYDPRSFYSTTPVNTSYLNHTVFPTIVFDGEESPMVISARYENRPDKLAYDLYGSSKLWWVFGLCNRDKLEDPIWDFKVGLEILVPSSRSVQRFI